MVNGGEFVARVALVATQHGLQPGMEPAVIEWEVSADGGATWEAVPSDGTLHLLDNPGFDLRWRSNHLWSGDGLNPTVSFLEIMFDDAASLEDNIDPAGFRAWAHPNPSVARLL